MEKEEAGKTGSAKEEKVKVYSTPTCPYCVMAKEFLKEKGVEFEDVNVAEDQKAAKEMMDKSGQMGVPQIEINGKIIVGFDKEALEKELGTGEVTSENESVSEDE